MHAHIINGAVVDYPYFLRGQDGGNPARAAKRLYPEVSPLPGSWEQCSPEQLAALHSVPVVETARPEVQPGESCAEGTLEYVDGQWRQALVVTAAPADADLRAGLIAQIKQLARSHILAALPEWKQTNMAARAIELTRIQMSGAELSPTEAGELALLESAWAWVKAVRAASDAAEAALASMTRAELDNWTEPTWPVFGA